MVTFLIATMRFLRAELDYPVNQKKGIAVGQNGHDLPYVQLSRRWVPGILVFHGRRADYKLPAHLLFDFSRGLVRIEHVRG